MKKYLIVWLLAGSFGAVAQIVPTSPAADDKSKTDAAMPAAAKKWTCTAEGLAEFRYDGSGWAHIRLAAYLAGGNYRVSKDTTGDVASGVTADRTPFVCANK